MSKKRINQISALVCKVYYTLLEERIAKNSKFKLGDILIKFCFGKVFLKLETPLITSHIKQTYEIVIEYTILHLIATEHKLKIF